jgi:hypothetical protein
MDEPTNNPNAPLLTPFEPYADDRAARRSSWPMIFGVISLVVGVLGTCVQGFGAAMSMASDKLMKMGGMDVSPAPKSVQYLGGAQAVILMLLGIVLIVGATLLILRRPLGAKLVRIWAFSRLVMVVLGLGAAVLTLKDQVSWQVTMNGEIRESLRKRGVKDEQLPPIQDADAIGKQALWGLVGASVAFAVWPFVMAIVLTNRRNCEDIASWGSAQQRG